MNSPHILYSLNTTLERQVDEIRSQRDQALKVLRLYVAMATILIAVFSTLISTSVLFPFSLEIVDGHIVAPLLVLLGLILSGRGIIMFYRGVFHALEVLSVESVERHAYLSTIYRFMVWVRQREWPKPDRYPAMLGPDFEEIENDSEPEKLVEEYRTAVRTNTETIESNNNHLRQVYQKMAWGITRLGLGISVLFLAF